MRTKYSTLSDAELLSYLRSLPQDELISELVTRLERLVGRVKGVAPWLAV